MTVDAFATPKTGISYKVYPSYESVEKHCLNCLHWDGGKNEWGYCHNLDMPALVEGGLTQPVKFCFSCPLYELRESEGEGG